MSNVKSHQAKPEKHHKDATGKLCCSELAPPYHHCVLCCVMTTLSLTLPLSLQCSRLQKRRVFFSKSVKKQAKCGVRVLRARRLTRPEKKNRLSVFHIFFPYFQRLSPVSLSVFSLVPDLLFDFRAYLNTQKYGLFCSLTVLPSSLTQKIQILSERSYQNVGRTFLLRANHCFTLNIYVFTRQGTIKDNNTE